jgi:hypothetical protein
VKTKLVSIVKLVVPVLGCLACDEPLTQIELVDKTRVVAAKVEVSGDSTRAAPLPGEEVKVRWLVLDPDPAANFAFALEACVAQDTDSALAPCAAEALAHSESRKAAGSEPSLTFEFPKTASGNERLAVLGSICRAGTTLDAEAATCSDGLRPQAVRFDFSADDGNHPNLNPAIVRVQLNGRILQPESASTTECEGLESISAVTGKQELLAELDLETRDALPQQDAKDPAQESLLVSYFVTLGSVDHAWSGVSGENPAEEVSTQWTPPEGTDEAQMVRLVVVVRDGRGGTDFAERRVCVTR